MTAIPEDLLYNAEHDWVRVEDDIGLMGITDYAQGELGDIVFLELPGAGDRVVQGEPYGTVEAVKTVADLYPPMSGEVIEVNTVLTEDAAQVNTDPYGAGWMIKVRLQNRSEAEGLLGSEAYGRLIQE